MPRPWPVHAQQSYFPGNIMAYSLQPIGLPNWTFLLREVRPVLGYTYFIFDFSKERESRKKPAKQVFRHNSTKFSLE